MRIQLALLLSLMAVISFHVQAQLPPGVVENLDLDYGAGNTSPALEIKVAARDTDPQELVVISLYNRNGMNIIAAHVIESPYTNADVTFFDTIDSTPSGQLFALGDGCSYSNGGERVVFPYIDNSTGQGRLMTAIWNGATWQVIQQASNYDTADCASNLDGDWISGRNRSNNRIDVLQRMAGDSFSSLFCIGGSDGCTGGDSALTSDDVLGPAVGAVRDGMSGRGEDQHLDFFYMLRTGLVRSSRIDTSSALRAVMLPDETCDIAQHVAPVAFSNLAESGFITLRAPGYCPAPQVNTTLYYSYVTNEANRYLSSVVNYGTCQTVSMSLGGSNGGSLGFRGVAGVGDGTQANILWGDWFLVDTTVATNPFVSHTFTNTPNGMLGGPVAACRENTGCDDNFHAFTADGNGGLDSYTFYGRYVKSDSMEEREPLSTTFYGRYSCN